MIAQKRLLSNSLKRLSSKNNNLSQVYANIFYHPSFQSLRNRLPVELNDLDPFQFSESLNKVISEACISEDEKSLIHNTLIEKLTKYEYGISTLHTKKLKELGRSPTYKSIIEIIRNNPGRVADSWELLLKFGSTLQSLPDEILVTTLENVSLDTKGNTSERKALSVKSIAQSVLLLENISQKERIKPETLENILVSALETDMTCVLPLILSFGVPSLKIFEKRSDFLTPSQIYQIRKFTSFDLLKENTELLYKCIDILGQNATIEPTEKEVENFEMLKSEILKLSKDMPSVWKVYSLQTGPQDTTDAFSGLFDEIQTDKLDRRNLHVARKLLRIFGTYRDNTKISLELYHNYLISYPSDSHDLMFETFLALSFQSYKTSNETLLEYAQAFIPVDGSQSLLANIYRVLILVNSRFNIEKSLEVYNENIDRFSKENDTETNVSPSGLLAESLILAYLTKSEIEFARVIFEGCAREKVFKGPTAVKRVKKLLSIYGEALESESVTEIMEQELLKTLKHI